MARVHEGGWICAARADSGVGDAGGVARRVGGAGEGEEVGASVPGLSGDADGADASDAMAVSEVRRGGEEWGGGD